MQKLNFVRKSPHSKPPENQKEIWRERENQRREEKKQKDKKPPILLPTDEIAKWTPEQWQEFERRIGIKPRA